jgi:hypothetical protein
VARVLHANRAEGGGSREEGDGSGGTGGGAGGGDERQVRVWRLGGATNVGHRRGREGGTDRWWVVALRGHHLSHGRQAGGAGREGVGGKIEEEEEEQVRLERGGGTTRGGRS